MTRESIEEEQCSAKVHMSSFNGAEQNMVSELREAACSVGCGINAMLWCFSDMQESDNNGGIIQQFSNNFIPIQRISVNRNLISIRGKFIALLQ